MTDMAPGLPKRRQRDFIFLGVLALLCLNTSHVVADTLDQIDVIGSDENSSPTATGDVVEQEHSGFTSHIAIGDSQTAGSLTLGDLVSQEAGSQVRSSGGLGSYSEISLRGASSEQVMIYLDGLLLNEGSGGGVDLSLIDLSQIDRIDIYRGSTPIQLGNASFGGAVNLVTPRTSQGTKASLSATAGSFGTQKLNARLSGRKEKLDGLVAIGVSSADNDFQFKNDNGTQYNPNDDRTEGRNNAEVTQASALMKMGWQRSDTQRADLSLKVMKKDQALPSWNNHENTDTEFNTKSWNLRGKLNSDSHFDDKLNTSFELYAAKKNEIYDDRNSAIGLGAQYDENITRTQGIKHYMEWLANVSTTSVTTDFRQEKYSRDDRLHYKVDDTSKRRSMSLGIQHNRFLHEDRLTLTPQLRYQRVINDFENNNSNSGKRNNNHINPSLGFSYAFSDKVTLKSNLGRYVREPAFYELFGDRGFFLGNDDLKAETGTNFDLGVIWDLSPAFWNLTSAKTQVSLWKNSIDDMIARTYDARGVGKSQNIASARTSGIELDTRWAFKNKAAISLNFTLQQATNQSSNAAFKNKQLPGRAARSFYSSFELPVGAWTIRYELDLRHKLYYDTANLLKAKNRHLHNLRFSRGFTKQLNAVLELNNLTDQQHEDFNGYPKPGRAVFITLNYNFNTSEAP